MQAIIVKLNLLCFFSPFLCRTLALMVYLGMLKKLTTTMPLNQVSLCLLPCPVIILSDACFLLEEIRSPIDSLLQRNLDLPIIVLLLLLLISYVYKNGAFLDNINTLNVTSDYFQYGSVAMLLLVFSRRAQPSWLFFLIQYQSVYLCLQGFIQPLFCSYTKSYMFRLTSQHAMQR